MRAADEESLFDYVVRFYEKHHKDATVRTAAAYFGCTQAHIKQIAKESNNLSLVTAVCIGQNTIKFKNSGDWLIEAQK